MHIGEDAGQDTCVDKTSVPGSSHGYEIRKGGEGERSGGGSYKWARSLSPLNQKLGAKWSGRDEGDPPPPSQASRGNSDLGGV